MNRTSWGSVIAVVLLAAGVGAAGVSWWFYRGLQARPLEVWGAQAARLILRAPRAELLVLEPESSAGGEETLEVRGQQLAVVQRIDVSRAKGFSHVRNSLMNEAAYDPDAKSDDKDIPHKWGYALRFTDEGEEVTLAFAFDRSLVARVGSDAEAGLGPIGPEIEKILREYAEEAGREEQ